MLSHFSREVNNQFQMIWNVKCRKALIEPDLLSTNDGFHPCTPRVVGLAAMGPACGQAKSLHSKWVIPTVGA